MEDSLPTGEHMTQETFAKALAFTRRVEEKAWTMGCPRYVLLSGGEPTEHPDIVRLIETVVRERCIPYLVTNGLFLHNAEMRAAILRPSWRTLLVQVTHDPRYYTVAPPRIDDPRIDYTESLSVMVPLGRFRRGEHAGEVIRSAPTSFNLRSHTHATRDFSEAVRLLRLRAVVGLGGLCTPTVSHNGDVLVGESRFCWKIGTVDSTNEELTRAVLTMGSCNRCGLETGLSLPLKRAVGITSLFGPDE
jgi:hypothetical protein